MTVLNIRHTTIYRYREPVRLGPHRLMLRLRESREVRLLSSTLTLAPAASLSWTNDVFETPSPPPASRCSPDRLTVESLAVVELGASAWPVFDIAGSAINYPFSYSAQGVDRSRGVSCRSISMHRGGWPTGRAASCAASKPTRCRC